MTTQEKLNELTTEIRKSIPRLMELSEGCVIKPHKQNEFVLDATYKIKETKYGTFVDSLMYMYDTYCDSDFEIIGHEPKLNDLLEWFLSVKDDSMLFTSTCGNIFLGLNKDKQIWDLSKSKLSDQSEQLINFLHDLIK